MSNSGPDGAGARRVEETNEQEYARLRDLLVGPERAQLAELEARLRDFSIRASDVGDVLPEAVLLRAERDPALRQALQPVMVEALRSSIRKDPSLVADTMFPIIGAAVRKAVASALEDMTDTLNRALESSLSLRSLGWRIEAFRTGRSFAEIALLRSLLYRVEQVFLIHRGTGLLLGHVTADSAEAKDPALVGSMLSAIQDFVHDSFGGASQSLEMVRVGGLSVWIQHGPQALLAGVVRGTAPAALRAVFAGRIEAVHRDFAAELAGFDGDTAPFEPCRPLLEGCLLGQGAGETRRSYKVFYAVAALLVLALGAGIAWQYTQQKRWSRYLESLAQEPGVVVTQHKRSWNRFQVTGLRDPMAPDPARLLAAAGIPPDKVAARWEPFLSLDPRFAAARDLPRLRAEVERHTVRFETGQALLSPEEQDGLKTQAGRIVEFVKVAAANGKPAAITVTGSTDEYGPLALNEFLAKGRAEVVVEELRRQGVDAKLLISESVGAGKALGRRVTFRVNGGGR